MTEPAAQYGGVRHWWNAAECDATNPRVVQRSCSGASVAALAWGVDDESRPQLRYPEPGIVLLATDNGKLGFFDIVHADGPGDVSTWWRKCFAELEHAVRGSVYR